MIPGDAGEIGSGPETGTRSLKSRKGLGRRCLAGVKGIHVYWGLVLCMCLCFLWSAFSGSQGIFSFVEQKKKIERIDAENRKIILQNQEIKKDIYLLKTSPSFIKKTAREELGYVEAGDRLYLPDAPTPFLNSDPVP
jgi:cell division protein FtsB